MNALKFSASKLSEMLENGTVTKEKLSSRQRTLLVQHWEHETNLTPGDMGERLGISRQAIYAIINKLEKYAIEMIAPFETEQVARRLCARAKNLMNRARKAQDFKTEWTIEKDLVEQLGKMGFIYYKGEPINVNVHVGDKKETNVTTVSIGAGSGQADVAAILAAISRETEEVNRLATILGGNSAQA